jgi:delta24(24(1))-sterol reductase
LRKDEEGDANESTRSPFPWFYFVFFMVMIIHRAMRDIARCRRKYGEAWTQYEKEVPYLFIPVSRCQIRVTGYKLTSW